MFLCVPPANDDYRRSAQASTSQGAQNHSTGVGSVRCVFVFSVFGLAVPPSTRPLVAMLFRRVRHAPPVGIHMMTMPVEAVWWLCVFV